VNKAEVEADFRDHREINRNEKEESQNAFFRLTRTGPAIQGKRGSGTPAKVYKRRVTNQGCANHF
jgi:hypothetical protein